MADQQIRSKVPDLNGIPLRYVSGAEAPDGRHEVPLLAAFSSSIDDVPLSAFTSTI